MSQVLDGGNGSNGCRDEGNIKIEIEIEMVKQEEMMEEDKA